MTHSNNETQLEYYGNSDDYTTHWIALEDVCNKLNLPYELK